MTRERMGRMGMMMAKRTKRMMRMTKMMTMKMTRTKKTTRMTKTRNAVKRQPPRTWRWQMVTMKQVSDAFRSLTPLNWHLRFKSNITTIQSFVTTVPRRNPFHNSPAHSPSPPSPFPLHAFLHLFSSLPICRSNSRHPPTLSDSLCRIDHLLILLVNWFPGGLYPML